MGSRNQYSDSYNWPKKKRFGFKATLQLTSLLIIIGVFAFVLLSSLDNLMTIEAEKSLVEAEISKYNKKIENLEEQLAEVGSEAHIERLARDALGYIKENEIIFIIQ